MPKIHLTALLIFTLFSAGIIILAFLFKSPQPSPQNIFEGTSSVQEAEQEPDLFANFFQLQTAALPQKYAVYVKNLNNQKEYNYNAQKKMNAASIYKIAVMYATYSEIKAGNLKENDSVSGDKNRLSQSLLGQPTPQPNENIDPVSFNIKEAVELMITISDNYSALLLAEKIGWVKIDKLMEQEGFPDVDLLTDGTTYITAETTGRILEKIYMGKAVSKGASQEMLNILTRQKINDKIPQLLPSNIKIAHKTGELENVRNDAGIIFGTKGDYIFVFLAQDENIFEATENIAKLSKEFFDELEK